DLRELPEAEQPRELLVLDGTWHTARTLFRDKSYLHALPRYKFLPRAPGRYRLRREPRADYVSTIEAIVEALRILEPETAGLDALLAAFDRMIDRQISLKSSATGRERKRRRPIAQRRTPRVLVENFRDLVLVYGEPSRPSDESQREFVYWVAHAIGSGATFEQWIVPSTGLPDRDHLEHMGLSRSDFERALRPDEFRSAWRAFLADTSARPIVAAWNQRTLDLLARTTDHAIASTSLKSAYRAVFGADAATLDDVIAQRALALEPNALRGRASTRLASLLAVARFLHARAS
ncbi:MAG TPA: DTW domain-containing protein, partial [Polyangiales bacterium]